MPVVNRVADFQQDIAAWRQDIHANPELLYDVHRTAGIVAVMIRTWPGWQDLGLWAWLRGVGQPIRTLWK